MGTGVNVATDGKAAMVVAFCPTDFRSKQWSSRGAQLKEHMVLDILSREALPALSKSGVYRANWLGPHK